MTGTVLRLLLVLAVVAPVEYLWTGYVLCILWNWFVLPLGAPSISIANAVGLGLLLGLLHPPHFQKDHEYDALAVFIRPLAALAIGAIVHAAM